MKFVIFKGIDNKWRWRLKTKNGRIVAASGESFYKKANAVRAAMRLRQLTFHATLQIDE